MSQRERAAPADGGTVTPVTLTSRRGGRLAGLLHLPAGARDPADRTAVVLCHGMESTKEGTKHQALAERLTACGYVVLRFDFSYVGESAGTFEHLTISGEVDDLAGACDFLWRRGTQTLGFVGSSLGGTVALLFAGGESRVRALVTIAAVSRPAGIIERMAPAALAEWRRLGYRQEASGRLGRGFLDDLPHHDVLAAASRLRAATLVAHGDRDRVVPVEDAYALYAALPEPKELAITAGGDHRYAEPQHLSALLDRSVEWIATHLKPTGGSMEHPGLAAGCDAHREAKPSGSSIK